MSHARVRRGSLSATRAPGAAADRRRPASARGVALTCLVLLLIPACAVNPVTGERQLSLISEAEEIEIGRQNDEQIVAQMGIYDDPKLQDWISQVGQRMAAASERPDLPWTFRVLDDDTVNAFALPGGFIYMTRGILIFMNSEAQVAGVLGHEIAHVTARHSVQQLSRAQLTQLGLGIGMILSPEVAALGDVLQTGLGLLFLKFSRDHESQADELGVRYAADAGFDPRELSGFFGTLDRLSGEGGGRLPTWMSTHPDPGDRQRRVLDLSEPFVGRGGTLTVGHDPHLRRLDGVVFGPDPREGVVIDGTFKHPDLLFQLEFPSGWDVINSKTRVVAAPEDGDVAMQLMLQSAEAGTSLRDVATDVVRAREGRDARGEPESVGGIEGYRVRYQVAVESVGLLQLDELFLRYRGNVYDLVGYAPASAYRRWADTVRRSQRSFRSLPEGEARGIQPDRVDIFTAARTAPFGQLVSGLAGVALPVDRLALVNGLQVDTRVESGRLLKSVRPGR